jgi:hypothetical protein
MEKYDNSHENQEISILRNHVNKEIHCAQGREKRKTQRSSHPFTMNIRSSITEGYKPTQLEKHLRQFLTA